MDEREPKVVKRVNNRKRGYWIVNERICGDLCGGNVDARMFDDRALMTMKRMSRKATDIARESGAGRACRAGHLTSTSSFCKLTHARTKSQTASNEPPGVSGRIRSRYC